MITNYLLKMIYKLSTNCVISLLLYITLNGLFDYLCTTVHGLVSIKSLPKLLGIPHAVIDTSTVSIIYVTSGWCFI